MLFLCVSVYCHRVTTQLQLINIIIIIIIISTVNVTGCTVLTLCDGQLAVPASNCTLCGYVL